MRVPLMVILPIALAVGGVAVLVLRFALRAQQDRVATGREGLVGEMGNALSDLSPRGKVFVHGETWDARSGRPVRQGQRVRVLGLEGMELEVEPVED
jgi:membrane-bound serine protease (ClpP class)